MKSASIHARAIMISMLCSLASFAPAIAGGPTYTRFGLGDLLHYGGSRLDAMGGTGISMIGDGFLNLINPAGIARIAHTRFAGGFEYTDVSSSDALNNGRYARGAFKSLAFGFPIDKDYGVALLLEVSPYSNVNYSTQLKDSLVQQDFYGTGGLTNLAIGASVSPAKNLTLGAKFNYIYGAIGQVGKFTFSDPSFLNSEIDRSDFYSGFNFTIGGIYEGIGDLLSAPSLAPLSIGFVLSTPTTLNVSRQGIVVTNEATDTTLTGSSTADVPLAYGLGISYLISNRYFITGDAYIQQWKNAKFLGTTLPMIRNSSRVAVGFESLPQRETDSYLMRVAYRAGFYYYATSYDFNGTAVNEMAVTGGLGLPIGPDARLDINLQFGTRGTTSNNLQRDTIFRLSLSLSASEIWFMKSEDE